MGLLEARVELITGPSRAIGRAMSERFARAGAAVVRAARSADQMKETAAVISATGARAIAIVCDAGVEGDVRRTAAIAVKEFRKLDTFVNNAGDAGPTKAVQGYLVARAVECLPPECSMFENCCMSSQPRGHT